MSKTYSKTRILVECALMIAIGTVLSNIKIFTMPNGGSVTLLSMLPFVLVSFRHGVKWGLFTGLVNGCLQMLLGFWAPPTPTFIYFLGEVLLDYLRKEGFDVTQATISRDIRELCLVKAATAEGYRYVSSRNESFNPKTQGRFETIFHESVLGVDYAGHVVLVKCYSGMANAACEVFDALQWKNVVGTLSGDDTFLIVARSERDAKTICTELTRHIG